MLPLTPTHQEPSSEDVAHYVARAPSNAKIVLDDEHDRFVWLPLEEALPRCLPPKVAAGRSTAAASIDARSKAS
jgi:hypothetical protein